MVRSLLDDNVIVLGILVVRLCHITSEGALIDWFVVAFLARTHSNKHLILSNTSTPRDSQEGTVFLQTRVGDNWTLIQRHQYLFTQF